MDPLSIGWAPAGPGPTRTLPAMLACSVLLQADARARMRGAWVAPRRPQAGMRETSSPSSRETSARETSTLFASPWPGGLPVGAAPARRPQEACPWGLPLGGRA